MIDEELDLALAEGLEAVPDGDPLSELSERGMGELGVQLGLPDEHDLQELLGRGFEVGNESEVLEHVGAQVLRLVETPKHDPASGSTQRYFTTIAADPGRYTLKFVVVDDANRRGSVERVVNASLAKAGPIQATDLLVAEAHHGGKNDSSLAPAVSTDFKGETLHGYLELFADAPEVLEMATVTLEVAQTASSPALERAPVQLQTPTDDAKCRIAGASIGISSLPSGDYVARAVIALGGKTVGQVLRPFRVARTGL